jgi:DNA polymerase/3'-5' exonuclease PolX
MSIMQLTQTVHIIPPAQLKYGKHPLQPTLPGMEPEPSATPSITNRQIAEVLAGIADMLEAQRGNAYRIQAYRNGARGLLDLSEPAVDILARGEALPIPGLGERLRSHIAELIELGSVTISNGFCIPTLPMGVRALIAIEHIGPYTAIRLHEELGIDSPQALWQAAQQGRIRHLPGFGVRSEARLKEAAERFLKDKKSLTFGGAA